MTKLIKDSSIKWIGDIPAHWDIVRLGHVFKKKKKVTGKTNLPTISLSFGKVINKKVEILEETHAAYQEVKIDNILVNPLNLNFDLKSLRIGISKIHGCASSGYIVLDVLRDNPNYFNYLLHIFDLVEMKNLGAGVRQTISFDDLRKVDIVLPPKEQQTAIANYLDQETSKIDHKISILEQKYEKLEEYKQSVIFETVTKGLDSNVEMKDSEIDWIGEIPKHWEILRLKDAAIIKKGESFDEKLASVEGIYPYINGGINPSDWSNHFNTNENTIAVSEGGASAGYTQFMSTKYWAGSHCYKIQSKNKNSDNKYLFYVLKGFEKYLMIEKTGSAMPNLKKTKFINYLVSLVKNIDEQNKIVDYLDNFTSKIDKKKEIIKKQIELLKEYKQTIIYEAVTGKIEIL